MSDQTLPYSELTAITPLDGRYRSRIEELAPVVSEYALIKFRMEIEIKYLLALSEAGVTRPFTSDEKQMLQTILDDTNFQSIEKVKETENQTRHDVKAMERTLRALLENTSLKDQIEMIHIGLTSEDINNIAYRLILTRGTAVILKILEELIDELVKRSKEFRAVPMLARTHGQPAVPTTVGKELSTFAIRLNRQVRKLQKQKLTGKLNGAVGSFNALHYVFPKTAWPAFSEKFISSFGLTPNLFTTQINQYDDVIEYLQIIHRINGILIDFNQDMWRYISDEWFVQVAKKGEVGSSTMPQKVNPIDFENAEGNLGIANGIIESMSRKLVISRLQRDLSDSTTIRNYGSILAYALVGYKSILTGLERVSLNTEKINEFLNRDWTILTEGLQTLLREKKYPDPYSAVSNITRGQHVNQDFWTKFLDNLATNINLDDLSKEKLQNLTPETYIGLAPELTDRAIAEIEESKK